MALEVKLEVFEGPLDLLLHLIEKNKVDIYDIPIVEITEQPEQDHRGRNPGTYPVSASLDGHFPRHLFLSAGHDLLHHWLSASGHRLFEECHFFHLLLRTAVPVLGIYRTVSALLRR